MNLRCTLLLFVCLLIAHSVQAQNILITTNNLPNEPSIIMDPRNPRYLVAGVNIDQVLYSQDTGRTWQGQRVASPYGVWGDPVMAVDTAGRFYFFHLSNATNWIDRIVCQRSFNQGKNWDQGTFMGLNGSKAQDKHWVVVDRKTNAFYVTWTQFDHYGSSNTQDSSVILFSSSFDSGATWSAAQRINATAGDCLDEDGTVEGAVPAVGPQGELYVTWAGHEKIYFNKSIDKGKTWEGERVIATMPGGWDIKIPGIYRANGLPVLQCDLSGGPRNGYLYLNWTDQRNGADDTDVWLMISPDGGTTWSNPIRVNNDSPLVKAQQFFSWMTVDQANGDLYFVFYDRRNYPQGAGNETEVFLAISKNGGQSFKNVRISESPFQPNEGIFFGDYTNITAHNGIVRPIWTRLHQNSLSVWTDITPVDQLTDAVTNPSLGQVVVETYPNPAKDVLYVSYKLPQTIDTRLEWRDVNGKLLQVIQEISNEAAGAHVVQIPFSKSQFLPGQYFIRLVAGTREKTLRVVKVE